MAIQEPAVFKELHMLVAIKRLGWGELAQGGHALLLAALCCPSDRVLHVLRRWVALKTASEGQDCGYDALEELVKGGDPSLFTKQTGTQQSDSAPPAETEEKPASEALRTMSIEKAVADEVLEAALASLKENGVINRIVQGVCCPSELNCSLPQPY